MLEIILLVVAGAALIAYFQRPPQAKVLATPAGEPPAPAVRTLRPSINIDGTERLDASPTFVAKFGLSPKHVASVNTLKGNPNFSELPAQAQAALTEIFAEGGTRGPDIVQYIHNSQPLAKNQTVYFVLTAGRQGADLCAFVDEVRS